MEDWSDHWGRNIYGNVRRRVLDLKSGRLYLDDEGDGFTFEYVVRGIRQRKAIEILDIISSLNH